ncbi:ABC transporter permease [Bacteroides sp. UBA939]|uniref:ABC transporter permease n=1 Tax=Bacteroides sp. UBA939 TaxID=1946092 RepID=UPI0025C044A5|nr:ABC transporter permease [Bacteroides sp. UBA939]
MSYFIIFKFIIRGWWRNKIFFLISLFSLTVGLACTNLLFTFFIHEYNIESSNLNKERIFCLRQDDPMQENKKVAYAVENIPVMLRDNYAEIEDFLRINEMGAEYCKLEDALFTDITFICVDTSLVKFFDYKVNVGNLKDVLKHSDQLAISEKFAKRIFGTGNPVGKHLDIGRMGNNKTYEIRAVVKDRPQSFLHFDLLTGIDANFWGGFTLLKLSAGSHPQTLAGKINKDKVPTLLSGETQYYIDPLKDLYFVTPDSNTQQILRYVQQGNAQFLYISLVAALLILIIACFNYSNLTLSRTLQQLKMIHVEKLMGSTLKDIRLQLFGDAFLTVIFSFLLSLLIISDSLSFFNQLVGAHLNFRFFFSMQMLPLLLLFVLVIAIVPGIYISHKLSRMSLNEYKAAYTGKKKRMLVYFLVILQFVISIGLLFATLVANGQMQLIKERAYCYEDRIETGSYDGPPATPLMRELQQNVKGIESITLSSTSVLHSMIRNIELKQADGREERSYLLELYSDKNFLETIGIHLLQGEAPEILQQHYAYPVVVNESYVRTMLSAGVSPIGHPLREFDASADSTYIIGGIIEDFPISSLENAVCPIIIHFPPTEELRKAQFLQIRLRAKNKSETLKAIQQIWENMNPGQAFTYTDMHQTFIKYNNKVLILSKVLISYSLIGLILTCFGLFGISWYATRQRIREIGIRKIHGATTLQIMWQINKSFFWQIGLAYIIAIPVVFRLMQHWREQFAHCAKWSAWTFILPFLIVAFITILTVCLHSYLAARTNPVETIKSE